VTRSEEGMTLFRPARRRMHEPAQAREVYDVSGAGDTVIATLAVMLASGPTCHRDAPGQSAGRHRRRQARHGVVQLDELRAAL
jgi:sugar/nucleoside kinase (ribokinase family)